MPIPTNSTWTVFRRHEIITDLKHENNKLERNRIRRLFVFGVDFFLFTSIRFLSQFFFFFHLHNYLVRVRLCIFNDGKRIFTTQCDLRKIIIITLCTVYGINNVCCYERTNSSNFFTLHKRKTNNKLDSTVRTIRNKL